jgi:hypothetical protein
VERFLAGIEDEARREECRTVAKMMKQVTRAEPEMWGPSIVGFGRYSYRYESGREGEWMLTGFSPRKQALTLYIMSGFSEHEGLLAKLGRFKTGKSCLYIKRLSDVDLKVLKQLIQKSVLRKKKSGG